ncbi:MAG: COX15/CtaA family protein [Saprospiraceae bacterium]|jgi:cytochrome c oxidase assembly protein subunit 15|nr:COX15/CtaA family protein [Saprospiraceae bacterium]MBP9209112.1 COX15/CtaA family protein [Saprospiraceae bacterium]MBV6473657.1 Heme A synthase [Saprospiraceae bacterium]
MNGKTDGIQIWLWIGMGLLLVQIFLGGVTRLTGSGLSITRWDIVTGLIYPLNDQDWSVQFELYKKTPQYKQLNSDFQLQDFKFIFFWEYFHRLWARIMGLVFAVPFAWFLFRKSLHRREILQLVGLIFLAAWVAALGWIMVASGLVHRPWVHAVKLSLHLIFAVTTICFLLWIIVERSDHLEISSDRGLQKGVTMLAVLIFIQIFIGGMMAGMRAAIVAPDWPTIQGSWLPEGVFSLRAYSESVFNHYERSPEGPMIVQFWHRTVGYAIGLLACWLAVKMVRKYEGHWKISGMVLTLLILAQILLGVGTLVNSVGNIPLWWAVFHQITGIICLLYVLYLRWERFS